MKQPEEIVRDAYAALSKGDVPAFVQVLDPTIEWTEADGFPYAGMFVGPDAVMKNVIGRLVAEWDGFAVIPNEFVVDGDTVVALGSYSGTFRASGKSFRARFAHVWRIRENKAVAFEQVADTAKVAAAL